MEKSKIIFLDIDGVLNSSESFKIMAKENADTDLTFTDIPHPMHLINLQEIIKLTGALCVISSTWRKGCSRSSMFMRLFQVLGFRIPVIGVTPTLGVNRGREIDDWLKTHNKNFDDYGDYGSSWNKPVRKFIILDDDRDMEPHMDRLVKTDNRTGLLAKHIKPAVELLND